VVVGQGAEELSEVNKVTIIPRGRLTNKHHLNLAYSKAQCSFLSMTVNIQPA